MKAKRKTNKDRNNRGKGHLLLLASFTLLPLCPAGAQTAVVEESLTEVECTSATHAIMHFKEVTTILNEHGADMATFVCSCSKNDKLTHFKGQVTDATGRMLRKFKESELKRTEYSQYLAIDDYKMYLDYTPPVYPVTVSHEWTMESHDNLIELPRFCPQTDYDVSVKKAVYRLTAPQDLAIRYRLLNIDKQVVRSDDGRTLTLELDDLAALKQEPYARPLRERLPMAYFAPTDFIYYGTKGRLSSWADYGKWEYGLINGRDALPDHLRTEIHQMTDNLKTDREKVATLYQYLEKTTRYVAVLLGIGGQQPAPAASVSKSGFGDCKGLSNYMRAMLKEIGIASNYTTISTTNSRLLPDFASVGQMNHVILQVPLKGDTLWLECTNPQLPLGYLHEDIAGHHAIVVSEKGGELVQLPDYADSVNAVRQQIRVDLSAEGSADINVEQTACYREYENWLPLLTMDQQDVQRTILQMMRAPEAVISQTDIHEDKERVALCLNTDITSKGYATATGQRLFVPLCPVRKGFVLPNSNKERTEDLLIANGCLDESVVTLTIPDGYAIEAKPKDLSIEKPFGTFSFHLVQQENTMSIRYRLLLKKGCYDKSLVTELADFMKQVSNAYSQKAALKKM